MARALVVAAQSGIWANHSYLVWNSGDYRYEVQLHDNKVSLSVADAAQTASVDVQWAFGAGRVGQTFVFLSSENFYETRISYYKTLEGLALTTGHAQLPVSDIKGAVGRLLPASEVTRCFGCHATVEGQSLTPGVTCQACHENAAEHASSVSSKATRPIVPDRLSELSSRAMADRCGACHRTFQDISDFGPRTIENVRFQPYRLVGSRCFIATDRRISCVACHNPHEEVQTTPESYDSKCQACHQARSNISNIKFCRVATKACVTCHMPKVDVPEMHYKFTDHRIRIVHAGEKYPA